MLSIFSRKTHVASECAIPNERILNILLMFYNIILQQRHFQNRWLNVLEKFIEKGKLLAQGKNKSSQFIEVDLQLMMRMFLVAEVEEIIEQDSKFSKVNYRLRENCSIETAILEKRIMLDYSALNM